MYILPARRRKEKFSATLRCCRAGPTVFYEFWWGLLAAAWILVLGAAAPGLLLGGGRCITRQHMHAQISTTRSDRNASRLWGRWTRLRRGWVRAAYLQSQRRGASRCPRRADSCTRGLPTVSAPRTLGHSLFADTSATAATAAGHSITYYLLLGKLEPMYPPCWPRGYGSLSNGMKVSA